MTAYARIITIGRNCDMPKVVRIPLGVRVDGTSVTAPLTIQPDEILCPVCKGRGSVTECSPNPSVRDRDVQCDRCEGNGIVEVE